MFPSSSLDFFHKNDTCIESHIWLGLLAYQVANYITLALKEQGIHHHSWKTIVEKLKAKRITTSTIHVKGNKTTYIKTPDQVLTPSKYMRH